MVGKFSRMFEGNLSQLKMHLDPCLLVSELRDRKILVKEQVERITQKMLARVDQAQILIDILEQRPDSDWEKFCEALVAANQIAVIELLGIKTAAVDALAIAETLQPSSCVCVAPPAPMDIEERDDEDVPGVLDVDVQHTTAEFYDEHHLDAYPMHRKLRGIACIINVDRTDGHGDRCGTNTDRDKLITLFEQLYFDVKVFNDSDDLCAQGILDKVKSTAAQSVLSRPPQCYVLFVLSHGGMDPRKGEVLYGNDGLPLGKTDVLNALDCPNLKNTPRLVCFVSCRGGNRLMVDEADHVTVPGPHFVVGFPCQEDYVSLRNKMLGTRYVRCLVDLFMHGAHNTDVATLLLQVNSKLKELVKSDGLHQLASCHHTLRRKLFFFPGYVE